MCPNGLGPLFHLDTVVNERGNGPDTDQNAREVSS